MSNQTAIARRPTRPRVQPRDYLRLTFASSLILICAGMCFAVETFAEGVLVGLAIICGMFMLIPLIAKKKYCAFEPSTVVLAVVIFSVIAKLWMVLLLDDTSSHVQRRLLLGHDVTVLSSGLQVMAVAIGCFIIGYLLKLPRPNLSQCFMADYDQWGQKRMLLVALGITAASFVFFGLFVHSIGFKIGDSLSAKRFLEEGSGSANRMFELKYYYYRLAAFSKFAFYLCFVDLVAKRRRLISLQGLLMGVSGLLSVLIPIFLNNRAGVALLVIDAVVMLYFLRPKLVAPAVFVGGAVMFSLFVVLLVARKGDTQAEFSTVELLEETLGGRDLMDITKTSHIINAVPHEMEYRYGETLWGWLAAPIPRSIWENKPMWAERGPFIAHKVYGDMGGYTGVPPGLVAELYWNLGWYGVTVGMLITGVFCQMLFKAFYVLRDRKSAVVIYTIIINRVVLFSFGNDLGTGIVKAGLDVVPFMLLLVLVAKVRKPVVDPDVAEPEVEPEKEPQPSVVV